MDHLNRFLEAQEGTYERALEEVRRGRKTSHWMWFIFPQLKGLGSSPIAQRYGIIDLTEARVYLKHPLLGKRLIEIFEVLLAGKSRDAHAIFGSPDDMKLRSCATLFAQAPGANPVFKRVIDEFFKGKMDEKTLLLLQQPDQL